MSTKFNSVVDAVSGLFSPAIEATFDYFELRFAARHRRRTQMHSYTMRRELRDQANRSMMASGEGAAGILRSGAAI